MEAEVPQTGSERTATIFRPEEPKAVSFTEQEWTALFPSFPVSPWPLYGDSPPPDEAAELRKRNPMTVTKILEYFAKYPTLHGVAKLVFALQSLSAQRDLIFLSQMALQIPITALFSSIMLEDSDKSN